jgi:hypothetical protein
MFFVQIPAVCTRFCHQRTWRQGACVGTRGISIRQHSTVIHIDTSLFVTMKKSALMRAGVIHHRLLERETRGNGERQTPSVCSARTARRLCAGKDANLVKTIAARVPALESERMRCGAQRCERFERGVL